MLVKSDQTFNRILLLLWTDYSNVVVTEPNLPVTSVTVRSETPFQDLFRTHLRHRETTR